ncbi:putative E3 ubiquitin-protein ligase ZFP1 [Senna tora]|uniref:RING-type E3 ubiquitin transferase n=1 Tax=Senna tora TaxID=362788 RepID=A0A834TKS3_9FABA|nr:putative E3 ubiquitin-protein ligase ZFP1 [Senna tora]
MDQRRLDYFHSEPCIMLGRPNIPHPNIHTVVAASGNTSNIDSHYLPNAYDNGVMYGMAQFNGFHHQHNIDMGVAASSNLYYSGMNPSSGSGVLPQPINHRAIDQLPASDNFARGPYKRKITEGSRGNYQYFDATASSSVAPPNARHSEGVAMMDTPSFSLPQFTGNGIPSLVEVGPHGSMWSRSGESVMLHEPNHLIQGNYLGQHFQPAPPPWLDQQLNNANSDGHNTAWNHSRSMPYMQAPTVNGTSIENANMGMQRYHDTASNRSGLRFPHPHPVNHPNHNYHFPTLPMQGVRGHNFHPPVTAATYRVPSNSSRNTAIPVQNRFELGARHIGPAPSAGVRIYHPLRGFTPETTHRHRNFPAMSFLLVDDMGNLVDHHSDMRLDIEDMSYEELLALGERIGNVSTGLSEETITSQLKMKTYKSSTTINLEEVASEDQETDACIICQDEYKNRETIGILKCGHEYHSDCLKKWLLVKNVCPICKSEALIPGRKDV